MDVPSGHERGLTPPGPYERVPSTRYGRVREKIALPPEASKETPRRRRGFRSLSVWRRERPVRLTVQYKGGSEGWFLIQARGESQVFSGGVALEDVMARVYSER